MKKLIIAFIILLFTVNANANTSGPSTNDLIEQIMDCSATIYQVHNIQCATDIIQSLPEDYEFPPKDELIDILATKQILYDVFVVGSVTVQYAAICNNVDLLADYEAPVCAMFLELLTHEHN